MKLKSSIIVLVLFLVCCQVFAQTSAGTGAKYEMRSLIDMPTAGILKKGLVSAGFVMMPEGVLISKVECGAFNNFSFGISYGSHNLIGTGNVDFYSLPGVDVRFRVSDETEASPAISLGFDSQGKGNYDKKLDRYEIKSPGFFCAVSKNFNFLGFLSMHGVINYSLEKKDGDKDFDLQAGVEKTIGMRISMLAEYDFAINDNAPNSIGDGTGYLNMGLRWAVDDGLTLGLDLRNLLTAKKLNSYRADRGLFIEYAKGIF